MKRLFLLLGGLFLVFLISNTFSTYYRLFADPSIFLFGLISLLILLLGFHIHFFMVRLGIIPTHIPRPKRREFLSLVQDILSHEEFLKLKTYFHHTNHIYDHVLRVSYLSYYISKVLGLNYRAAARGGLLHDFFLYDWRDRKATDSAKALHGKEHPQIALRNARKYFSVSEREADIIIKHMYPKTRPAPRYIESIVVSISDKIATLYEYAHYFVKRLTRA